MMKTFFAAFLVLASATIARADQIRRTEYPSKEIVFTILSESAELPASQTMKVRLKKTLVVQDCNKRSLQGAFFKTEGNPYITVADFGLVTTESLCPWKEPKTITIYSETYDLVLSGSVAEGNSILIPADLELEVLP